MYYSIASIGRLAKFTLILFIGVLTAGILPAGGTLAQIVPNADTEVLEIEWKVARPFRFFKQGAEPVFAWHQEAYEAFNAKKSRLAPEQINERGQIFVEGDWVGPILFAERYLSDNYRGNNRSSGWAENLWFPQPGTGKRGPFRTSPKTCWDIKYRRLDETCLKASAGESAFFPKTASIRVQLKNREKYSGKLCNWSISKNNQGPFLVQANNYPCEKVIWPKVPVKSEFLVSVKLNNEESIVFGPLKIAHRLVIGLGDSYAAGEGNPDVPAGYDNRLAFDGPDKRRPRAGYQRRWLDWPCHRSVYSHQYRIGLQLALENPHRVISMISYACSGAEAAEIVSSFDLKKGYIDSVHWRKIRRRTGLGRTASKLVQAQAKWSQLDQVTADLCATGNFRRSKKAPEQCQDFKMPIDLVLMSVGGNDVGFSKVILWAIGKAPSKLKYLIGAIKPNTMKKWATDQIKSSLCNNSLSGKECTMKARYTTIAKLVRTRLKLNSNAKVLIGAYPTPLGKENGMLCSKNLINIGMDADIGNLKIKQNRIAELDQVLFHHQDFQSWLNSARSETGWTYDGYVLQGGLFKTHGICAVKSNNEHILHMPYKRGLKWKFFDPGVYRAYQSRQRWFRTFNDSILVQYQETDIAGLNKHPNVAVDYHYPSGISGAFHPTAEGQAAMADALMQKARCILDPATDGCS